MSASSPLVIALIAAALALAAFEIFRLRRGVADLRVARLAERRRLQTELDRREEYVASVGRELMNPIASIAYAARALHGGHGSLDVPSIAQGIANEAANAGELVRALTDAARAEARHLHLALRPVDLTSVTRATIESFDAGGHEIVLAAPPDPVIVRGDIGALAKVLRHLLSNAVTYAPTAAVRVEIGALHDADTAVLAVRDHGPGVPVEERILLFRKFARLSTAGGSVGAGLGLFVSRAIIEEHGGVLSVEWPSDGGSRFYFTVPLASQSAS